MPLTPCAACARHVDASARCCPFCEAPQPERTPRGGSAVQGMGRAAVFYFGLTLAACGPGEDGPPPETIAQPYGAPPPPEDLDPPETEEPPENPPETIAQPYGAPPEPPPEAPPEEPEEPPTE